MSEQIGDSENALHGQFVYFKNLLLGMLTGLITGIAASLAYDFNDFYAKIALVIILVLGIGIISLKKFMQELFRNLRFEVSDFIGVGLGTGLITGVGSIALYKRDITAIILIVLVIFALILIILFLQTLICGTERIYQKLIHWWRTLVSEDWDLFFISLIPLTVIGILVIFFYILQYIFIIYLGFITGGIFLISLIFGLMQGFLGKEKMKPAQSFVTIFIILYIFSMSYFWAMSTIEVDESLKWMKDGSGAIFTGIIGALAYDVIKLTTEKKS